MHTYTYTSKALRVQQCPSKPCNGTMQANALTKSGFEIVVKIHQILNGQRNHLEFDRRAGACVQTHMHVCMCPTYIHGSAADCVNRRVERSQSFLQRGKIISNKEKTNWPILVRKKYKVAILDQKKNQMNETNNRIWKIKERLRHYLGDLVE